MEEQLKTLLTACIVANVPLIAQAVVEELKKQSKTPQTMTRREAAKSLNVSLPTLDALISKGEIRGKKLGHRVIIPESEIVKLLGNKERIDIRGGKNKNLVFCNDRINRRETAACLKVSPKTLCRWEEEGYLKPIYINKRPFYSKSKIEEMIKYWKL